MRPVTPVESACAVIVTENRLCAGSHADNERDGDLEQLHDFLEIENILVEMAHEQIL